MLTREHEKIHRDTLNIKIPKFDDDIDSLSECSTVTEKELSSDKDFSEDEV